MSAEIYADVYSFLKLHTTPLELVDPEGGGRVLLAPELAARVMTSTAGGMRGKSYGWVNRRAFVGGRDPKFTNFGGEERLWLGPEGGQFSLYFPPNAPFTLEHWFVPKAFNDEPYAVVESGETEAAMVKSMALRNYSGTEFELLVERRFRIIPRTEAVSLLDVPLPSEVKLVAYETENTLINRGSEKLRKEKGLVSIWLLSMLNPSGRTAVLIPYRGDSEGGSGSVVNDTYFGPVPPGRLAVTDSVIVFKADGKHRCKIGVGPGRCRDRLGSLDLENGLLTVVLFSFSGESDYVNSLWEIHEDPYSGDVINSYNDGPPPGAEEGLGGFYELESSSPARELEVGEKLVHTQKIFHMEGPLEDLDTLSKRILSAGAAEARRVLS